MAEHSALEVAALIARRTFYSPRWVFVAAALWLITKVAFDAMRKDGRLFNVGAALLAVLAVAGAAGWGWIS